MTGLARQTKNNAPRGEKQKMKITTDKPINNKTNKQRHTCTNQKSKQCTAKQHST